MINLSIITAERSKLHEAVKIAWHFMLHDAITTAVLSKFHVPINTVNLI